MHSLSIVKAFHPVHDVRASLISRFVCCPYTRSTFSVLKKLSIGALSQTFFCGASAAALHTSQVTSIGVTRVLRPRDPNAQSNRALAGDGNTPSPRATNTSCAGMREDIDPPTSGVSRGRARPRGRANPSAVAGRQSRHGLLEVVPALCTNEEELEKAAVLSGQVIGVLTSLTAVAHIRAGGLGPLLTRHWRITSVCSFTTAAAPRSPHQCARSST